MSFRIQRLNELFKRELNAIIIRYTEDPRLKYCTITRVDISKDLSRAKVFFTVLGKEKKREKTKKGLIKAEGFLKSKLISKISLRRVPKLNFIFDEQLTQELALFKILDQIKEKQSNTEDNAENIYFDKIKEADQQPNSL